MAKEKHPGWLYERLKKEGVNVAVVYPVRGGYVGRRYVSQRKPLLSRWDRVKDIIMKMSKLLPIFYKKYEEGIRGDRSTIRFTEPQVQFMGGNVLADTVGWTIPRFLLDDWAALRKIFHTPEIIWADVVGNCIEGLIFVPSIPEKYNQRAVCVLLKLKYGGIQIAEDMVIKVIQLHKDARRSGSISYFKNFYRKKAEEFMAMRSLSREAIRQGGCFETFSIREIGVYKWKCGVDAVRISDISKANIHLWCNVVVAKNKDYCPITIKSKNSSDVTVKVPKRELGPNGVSLRERIKTLSKERYAREKESDRRYREKKRGKKLG